MISTSMKCANGSVRSAEEEEGEEGEVRQTTIGEHLETRAPHLHVIEVRQTETLEGLQIDGAEDEQDQS